MTSLESLTVSLQRQSSLQDSVAYLVNDLADRIKATSNDQNIQNLARDLKATAPDLVRAISGKAANG